MKVIKEADSFPIKLWPDDLGEKELQQLRNIASLPFIHRHIAVMPDAHLGIGCTIGSVIPTKKAIIPAAVGVDIGCGVMAVHTNWNAEKLPENLFKIRSSIERAVPLGVGQGYKDDAIFKKPVTRFLSQKSLKGFLAQSDPENLWDIKAPKWRNQLGSLGSGNHFIEICLDENDDVWVMLHSGSRGVGNQIAKKFIEKAKEDMRVHHINLPDKNISYLSEGTKSFQDYIDAVEWAQQYASYNRRFMMDVIFAELNYYLPGIQPLEEVINCHHNYVEMENHFGENVYVTRKGAIRAREDDLGIIPGSMGAKSYVVRGKGNQESFHSCSHGAGRKMSRTKARKTFSMNDLDQQTQGVELNKRKSILDEIPGAYKDIDHVMKLQSDLVEVLHTLKQVVCVKGD